MAKIRQFRWTRRLVTGLPVIDSQHKEYFNRVNNVLEQADMAESAELFQGALDFVRSYAVFHFDTEQEVMRFHNYPDFDAHLEQHHYFDEALDKLTKSFVAEGFHPALAMNMYGLLVDWFVNHIRTVDTRMGEFIISQSDTSAPPTS